MKKHTFFDLFGCGLTASVISAVIFLVSLQFERKLGIGILDGGKSIRTILAIILFALSIFLYSFSFKHLALMKQNKELVTSGPYRLVRHPRYAALVFFVYPASAFVMRSFLCLLSTVFVYFVFRYAAGIEESRLIEKFGQRYAKYRKVTPALLPRFLKSGKRQKRGGSIVD